MTILRDHASRSYYLQVAPGNGVAVRTHTMPTSSEQFKAQRQRMRQASREVLGVLYAARPRAVTFAHMMKSLPHVSYEKMQVRLQQLHAKEQIERHGSKGAYLYSLPEGSTFRST